MSKGSNYKFNQIFGYKGPDQNIHQQDCITSLKYDQTGQNLAVGDKSGRIIIFQIGKYKKNKISKFQYSTQFQSHISQLDFLNSQKIQQQITDICWLNKQHKYHNILATNAKTIKLWKIFQKTQKRVIKSSRKDLNTMPTLDTIDSSLIANIKHQFPNKHQTNIHTISKSYNQQYLLSFDSVQSLMWDLQRPDKPYLAIDYLKNMQLQQVKQNIMCGKFHPYYDSIFAYGTNKKILKIHDMRMSAQQNQKTIKFIYKSKTPKNFFTQYLETYSSLQFIKNGKYLVARDFLSVKVWDITNTDKPIFDINLNQGLKTYLSEMYEKDCFNDKFNLASSSDGNTILTGSYNNYFHMVDIDSGCNTQYQINYKKDTIIREIIPDKPQISAKMNYSQKTTACDFNKKKSSIVLSSLSCFYIYSMNQQKEKEKHNK